MGLVEVFGYLKSIDLVEVVGYFAMTFLVLSFIPKQILRIRVINLIGCLFFVAYGIMKEAPPVAISNGFVAIIQMYHLITMWKTKSIE